MNVEVQPGTYVVAVSGGVDSMVLLHALAQQSGHKLIVAHYDHGIRSDSHMDRKLVQKISDQYGLNFVYDEGKLGSEASEDTARKARYAFLRRVQAAAGADAVITAHHHNDVLETAVINMIRGTNRRGLSALGSKPGLLRPLLKMPKGALQAYAKDQGLVWREDSTNTDPKYLRNYVRQQVLSNFEDSHKQQLAGHIQKLQTVNQELDQQLANYLHQQPARDRLHRQDFIRLPHTVAREVMAAWLRSHRINAFDRKMLERLIVSAKTAPKGRQIDVVSGYRMKIGSTDLALVRHDR